MIRTERLLLRRSTPADEAPEAVVQLWLDGWEIYPAGKLIVETDAGERIGRVGFNFYDPVRWRRSSSPDALPELTWALAHEHWGHGYALEAATATRDWLGRADQISLISPRNRRSQRVAERLGATPGKTVDLPDGGPHVVWTHPR